MGVEFFETLSDKAKSTLDASKENAGKAAGVVAKSAGDVVGKAAVVAGAVKNGAGNAASVVANSAGTAAVAVAETAGNVTGAVAERAGDALDAIKEHSPESVVKRAKVSAFRDGINEGASLMADKAYSYSFALVALTMYVARCDGTVSEEEIAHLKANFKHLAADGNVPQAVKDELEAIARNRALTFDDVKAYLDKLSVETLKSLQAEVDEAIEADSHVAPEEEGVRALFGEYLEARKAAEAGEDDRIC